jgi:hypothetical protein
MLPSADDMKGGFVHKHYRFEESSLSSANAKHFGQLVTSTS